MTRKTVLHGLFFIVCFCLWQWDAQAQEYRVSEQQLQTLETMLQNYNQGRQVIQKQLSQSISELQALQSKLDELQTVSNKQRTDLQQKQTLIEKLNASLGQLESNLQAEQKVFLKIQTENDKQKLTIQRQQKAIVTLLLFFVGVVLYIAVKIVIKVRTGK